MFQDFIIIYYQTLFWKIPPIFRRMLDKYENMNQNIRWYLEEKCLIIDLLCIFVNFNLKTVMPNVFCWQLETGLTSLIVKVVKVVFQYNHFNLVISCP